MINRMVSDEVTDGIAAIEMHRQGTEIESGLAVACSEALAKLQQLLAKEKEALQLNTSDAVLAANVEAVANEIIRIQAMAGIKGQNPVPRNARPRGERQPPRADKSHNSTRNRGRRTIGRSGGRGGGGRGGGGSGGVGGSGGGGSGGGGSGGR